MKVFIVYAHPSDDSFTFHAKNNFIKGLTDGGHSYVVSDLYKMNFKTDMSAAEYFRESNYKLNFSVPQYVLDEQTKINDSDAIVFIYPLFWAEAPAKLVGWFDRVWTYGFAYGDNRTMKKLDKALVAVTAGNSLEYLEENGHLQAMKTVMLNDRLFDRVSEKEMIIFDLMTKENPEVREANWDKHIDTIYKAGLNF